MKNLSRADFAHLIPQSPPFLFVDQILSYSENELLAEYTFQEHEPFFQGHFPGDPIVPGVLLCECALQAGALLMALQKGDQIQGKAVVTRMDKVKFKNFARPSEKLSLKIELKEDLGQFKLMSAVIKRDSTTLVLLEFMVGITQ
jgi:3-hydroxyacyl-[acyl-carrier-protein] dehydratase